MLNRSMLNADRPLDGRAPYTPGALWVNMSEALTLPDQPLNYAQRPRRMDEAVDASNTGADKAYVVTAESVTVFVDELIKSLVRGANISSKVMNEALTLVDEATKMFRLQRYATDALTPADEAVKMLRKVVTMSDTTVVPDEVVKYLRKVKVMTEGLTAFDEVLRYIRYYRLITDSAVLVDAVVVSIIRGASNVTSKTMTETIFLDDVGRQAIWVLTMEQYSALVDELVKSVIHPSGGNQQRTMSEALTIVDQIVRLLRIRRLGDEAITVDTDVSDYWREINANVEEDLTIADNTFLFTRRVRMMADTLSAIDSIIAVIPPHSFARIMSESLTLTDEQIRYVRVKRLMEETLTIADQLIRSVFGAGQILTRITTETVTVADQAIPFHLFIRMLSDTSTAGDQLVRLLYRVRSLFDSVDIVDGTILVRWSRRFLSEALDVSEQLLPTYIPYIRYDVHMRIGRDNPMRLAYDMPIRLGRDNFFRLGGYQ